MNILEKHPQWETVKTVCENIQAAGFEALLAGGCVRDMLMGRLPHDFDIATNATPEQLDAIFPKRLTVGREFGVTVLPFAGFQLEVATFRKDGPYLDGRRPSTIEYADAKEDACRRDFTVNALFYDLVKKQVLDFVDGEKDINAKILRTVGDPARRFAEDKLRLMRAVRFVAQLGFHLESQTQAMVQQLAPTLSVVAPERIRDELNKLLMSDKPQLGLDLLEQTGLRAVVLPEWDQLHAKDPQKWREVLNYLDLPLAPVLEVQLAILFYDLATSLQIPIVPILRRLKFSNEIIERVSHAVRDVSIFLNPTEFRVSDVLLVRAASHGTIVEDLARTLALRLKGEEQDRRNQALLNLQKTYGLGQTLPSPWLSGAMLKQMGYLPGPEWGAILDEAYRLQLEQVWSSQQEAQGWVQTQKNLRKNGRP